ELTVPNDDDATRVARRPPFLLRRRFSAAGESGTVLFPLEFISLDHGSPRYGLWFIMNKCICCPDQWQPILGWFGLRDRLPDPRRPTLDGAPGRIVASRHNRVVRPLAAGHLLRLP